MIRSFGDKDTAKVLKRQRVRALPPKLQRVALRRLLILDAAERLSDLQVLPANRVEKLSGDRRGHHSIRINDQWRVRFRWDKGHAHDVEIVDYH